MVPYSNKNDRYSVIVMRFVILPNCSMGRRLLRIFLRPFIRLCPFAMVFCALALVALSLYGPSVGNSEIRYVTQTKTGYHATFSKLSAETKKREKSPLRDAPSLNPNYFPSIVGPPSVKIDGGNKKLRKISGKRSNSYRSEISSNEPVAKSSMYDPREYIVNPHPFRFLLNEVDVCSRKRKDLFIISIIHTAPKNHKKRMLIRETWGSQMFYDRVKTVVMFAMGSATEERTQQSVRMESDRYRDIIQEDFHDSYRNLTYKGIMWLKWVSTYCAQADFVLKVDDDIFVNIFNLFDHLKFLQSRNALQPRTLLCLTWDLMPVIRDPKNKWFVSKDQYPLDKFSRYCSGSAFIITKDLIKPMYEVSLRIKFFWVDDFYLTGLLPQTLNATYKNIASLYVLKRQELHDRLVGSYAIFGHVPGSLTKRSALWKEVLEMRGIKPW